MQIVRLHLLISAFVIDHEYYFQVLSHLFIYFFIDLLISERTEIETLRTARNKIYGHRENACLTDTDFTVQWAAIESSIKAITRYCNDPVFENQLMQYIQRVKSGPLDLVGITDIFTRWFKTERSLQEELENVTDTIKDVSAMVKGKSTGWNKFCLGYHRYKPYIILQIHLSSLNNFVPLVL